MQAVIVYAFALMLLVWLANFAVFAYARGVVRAAIDEGARAGSRVSGSVERCEARAQEVMANLLAGTMGRGVTISCTDTGEQMRAQATVHFSSWAPPVPDWDFDVTAVASRTPAP